MYVCVCVRDEAPSAADGLEGRDDARAKRSVSNYLRDSNERRALIFDRIKCTHTHGGALHPRQLIWRNTRHMCVCVLGWVANRARGIARSPFCVGARGVPDEMSQEYIAQ